MCAVLLLALLPARALPAFTGPTGIITLPDALPAPAWIDAAGGVLDTPNTPGLCLRAVSGSRWGEVGALYLRDDRAWWGFNAKALLLGDGETTALGLGFASLAAPSLAGLPGTASSTRVVYLASTAAAPYASLTVGVGYTHLGVGSAAEYGVRPFVGGRVHAGGSVEVAAEWQGRSRTLTETESITSLMILYHTNALVTTAVGTTNADGWLGTQRRYYFAQLGMQLKP
jgi:hypothetical protein